MVCEDVARGLDARLESLEDGENPQAIMRMWVAENDMW